MAIVTETEKVLNLNEFKNLHSEVENYLGNNLLISISASFENEIRERFIIRQLEICSHSKLGRGNQQTLKKILERYYKSSFPLNRIRDYLKQVSHEKHKEFNQFLKENEQIKLSYDSIISARNNVAHKNMGGQLTWEEIKVRYAYSLKLLDKIKELLS